MLRHDVQQLLPHLEWRGQGKGGEEGGGAGFQMGGRDQNSVGVPSAACGRGAEAGGRGAGKGGGERGAGKGGKDNVLFRLASPPLPCAGPSLASPRLPCLTSPPLPYLTSLALPRLPCLTSFALRSPLPCRKWRSHQSERYPLFPLLVHVQ